MIVPIFLLLMVPQQPIEQELQHQQQQLEQIHRDLQQLQKTLEASEKQAPQEKADQTRSICSVELRRVNGAEQRRVPRNSAAVVPLNLFGTISRPMESCLPAEIRVTASYLDANDNLICSGVVENIAFQDALTQSVNLEIRPWNFREFVRWRNEPPQINSGPKRLVCLNPESTAEATPEDLDRAFSARVRATAFPKAGGLSTTEIQLNLR
jgi:hypothetical protein